MLQITKIFHFEMAHAIHGYEGPCKNLHGHSYELHVTVSCKKEHDYYIPAPGFILDFKQLKNIVKEVVVHVLDHKLVLSEEFLAKNPTLRTQPNLVAWHMEPTAENLLLFIKRSLENKFPEGFYLMALKLYETKDSYAEWISKG
jgi:6-pyruvoyltetrahydropterin/6-carboxytetrahydropterin synthase